MTLRPGITGLAQIEGIDMSDPGKMRRERTWSICEKKNALGMDATIVLKTVVSLKRGDVEDRA